MDQNLTNNPHDNSPYWMQALTDQEIADLSRIQVMVLTDDLDLETIKDRALLLVTRLADLFNESEEIETIEALSGDDIEDEDEDD